MTEDFFSRRLKGKELLDYVETHLEEFQGDGDALCLAAGYGQDNGQGTTKCNLSEFVRELAEVADPIKLEASEKHDAEERDQKL